MKSMKSLVGMPVVCAGRTLGRVSGVKLDEALLDVAGLWVDCGLKGGRFIDRAQLDILGDVAVLAADAGRRARREAQVSARRALSTDGRRLGAITDALIDERTWRVGALELSLGYADDLLSGRRRVSRYAARPGGEVVVDLHSEGGNGHERTDGGHGDGRSAGRGDGDGDWHDESADAEEAARVRDFVEP